MNLQTMEYFSVLARERSFTRAAEALHITQQSLSGHIAAVEQELGAQLVVRLPPHRPTMRPRSIKPRPPPSGEGRKFFIVRIWSRLRTAGSGTVQGSRSSSR